MSTNDSEVFGLGLGQSVAALAPLPSPQDRMFNSFVRAKEKYREGHKSQHWDHFVEDFEQLILTPPMANLPKKWYFVGLR